MKKYALLGVLVAVVISTVLVGTQTELFQGKLSKTPDELIPTTRTFNVTAVKFDNQLLPSYAIGTFDHKKLNIDLTLQYRGRGSLRFDTDDYNWKMRCHNRDIEGFGSVFVNFPTGTNNILTSGRTVTPRGELILNPDQLQKLQAGDGNMFCGLSYDKPDSHNNVTYGFANKRIKTSYQLHINDDNTVDVN